jgi:predicted DNA-binding protein (MmcQ/YjbR family)
MKQEQAEQFISMLGESTRDTESQPGLVLFKNSAGKIFAVIHNDSEPLRVEAKCDRQLAKVLRDKYETVQPSNVMEATTWNEIICADQLTADEVEDLLRLSYNLVAGESETTQPTD